MITFMSAKLQRICVFTKNCVTLHDNMILAKALART